MMTWCCWYGFAPVVELLPQMTDFLMNCVQLSTFECLLVDYQNWMVNEMEWHGSLFSIESSFVYRCKRSGWCSMSHLWMIVCAWAYFWAFKTCQSALSERTWPSLTVHLKLKNKITYENFRGPSKMSNLRSTFFFNWTITILQHVRLWERSNWFVKLKWKMDDRRAANCFTSDSEQLDCSPHQLII